MGLPLTPLIPLVICYSCDGIMIELTLFDPRNFRFADTSIHKCDSSGENIDISDTEEYGEQETDDSIEEWDDASHWYQQQDHDQDVDCDVSIPTAVRFEATSLWSQH